MEEKIKLFLEHPDFLPVIPEETIKERTETEKAVLHPLWYEQTVAEHIIHIKGAEIVF